MVPVWFAAEPAQAGSPDWAQQPTLTSTLSHPRALPVPTVCSKSLLRSAREMAAKQINFSRNWLLGRWKEIKLFSLNVSWQSGCFCCVVRETHPLWLTAALLVICWPGSILPRVWKNESSQGKCSLCQLSELMLRGHSTLCVPGLFEAVVACSWNTTP